MMRESTRNLAVVEAECEVGVRLCSGAGDAWGAAGEFS